MFEKEGIKYAIEETVGTECLSMPIEDFHFIDLAESQQEKAQCFKDGAEFGYNKANKEIKLLKETHRQSIDILVEQIEELHKANEWHYVKSGDLPAEDTRVLALMAGGEVCIAHFYRKNVWDKIGIVIAWKEIVLPKEIKEND